MRLILSILLDAGIIFFFIFAWSLTYYFSSSKSIDAIQNEVYIDYVNRAEWF